MTQNTRSFGILIIFLVGLGNFITGVTRVESRGVPSVSSTSVESTGECQCSRSENPKADLKAYRDALNYRQLYCLSGYHLQILPNGSVGGTRDDHDIYAIVLIDTVSMGTITIKGIKSNRYLAMNKKGALYGSAELTEECYFYERLIEDWYLTYASHSHPAKKPRKNRKREWYISLDSDGSPRKGKQSRRGHEMSHFRTKPVTPEKVPQLYDFDVSQLERIKPWNVYNSDRCIPM
ncbi:fibroblast growth factor 9-like [Glandiceps talaboti]